MKDSCCPLPVSSWTDFFPRFNTERPALFSNAQGESMSFNPCNHTTTWFFFFLLPEHLLIMHLSSRTSKKYRCCDPRWPCIHHLLSAKPFTWLQLVLSFCLWSPLYAELTLTRKRDEEEERETFNPTPPMYQEAVSTVMAPMVHQTTHSCCRALLSHPNWCFTILNLCNFKVQLIISLCLRPLPCWNPMDYSNSLKRSEINWSLREHRWRI